MSGSVLVVDGVDLYVDTTGDRGDPAILLIGGSGDALDWWPDEFCRQLAAAGRFVIRYDHRDTGQSVTYPVGEPGYTGADLVTDAVGVLDTLGLRSAHLVGISMGGALAQYVAVDEPDRVDSLVLISTTFGLPGGPPFAELPPMSADLAAYFDKPPPSPDRAAVVDYLVEFVRQLSGPGYFDEADVRRVAERVVDRSRDMAASLTNHDRLDPGAPPRGGYPDLRAPTLIIHGTVDPLFPYGHAEALARAIPDAALLPLPGVGHQMPPPATWPTVIPAILRHTSGGWAAEADRLAARSIGGGDPTGWFDRLYAAGAAGTVPMPWDRDAPHPLLERWAAAMSHMDGAGPAVATDEPTAATGVAAGGPGVAAGGPGVAAGGPGVAAGEPGAVVGRRRAVVVGCGLGADAEYVAGLGYDTVAFDVSDTAVDLARQRHPGSPVRYTVADLLDLPAAWAGAFDLVVEVHTAQALPDPPRRAAIDNIARLVAPGGSLVVVAFRWDPAHPSFGDAAAGPPWPLTRADIDAFAAGGLTPVRVDETTDPRSPGSPRWLAVFHRLSP